MPIDKSRLYDLIYNKADKLIKKYNPCGIHKDSKGYYRCNDDNKTGYTCCGRCKHIGLFGCVIENAACRVFLCGEEKKRHPVLGKKLAKLHRILHRYKIDKYYRTKEEIFGKKKETVKC